jgi:hypothetical protein
MKTQRFDAYRELVRQLLECQEGQELALIQANQHLIDADLIRVMREIAAQFAVEGELDAASFLSHWSVELSNALHQNGSRDESPAPRRQQPRDFQPAGQEIEPAPEKGDRAQAYMTLIKDLLSCRKGAETDILQAYSHLIDQGLVEEMETVAAMLAEKGDDADARFLKGLAEQLAGVVSQPAPTKVEFLQALLQGIQTHAERPEMIVELLTQHADQFDQAFLNALQIWAANVLPSVDPSQALKLAADLVIFSDAVQQVPSRQPERLLDIAIAGYEVALTQFSLSQFPAQWAVIQKHLGEAYYQSGETGHPDHMEAAIHHFQDALRVYTCEDFPQEWVMVQKDLAEAYRHRHRGDRTENLEKALDVYASVLDACVDIPQAVAVAR